MKQSLSCRILKLCGVVLALSLLIVSLSRAEAYHLPYFLLPCNDIQFNLGTLIDEYNNATVLTNYKIAVLDYLVDLENKCTVGRTTPPFPSPLFQLVSPTPTPTPVSTPTPVPSSTPTPIPTPTPTIVSDVILCRDVGNLNGICETFKVRSDDNLTDNTIGNDQASSIFLPSGASVTLCRDAGDHNGICQTFTASDNDLISSTIGNDQASALFINTGRYKLDGLGNCYYDPIDTGSDQCTP